MNTLLTVHRVMLIAALGGGVAFVVSYQLLARWWRTVVGRSMMAFAASETLLLTTAVIAWLWPEFPQRRIIGVISFGLFVVVSWWRVIALWRAQLLRRRDKAEP